MMQVRHFRPILAFVLAVALPCVSSPTQAAPIANSPSLASSLSFTGYVVDQAEVIDSETSRRLTITLGRFQKQTAHQIAVVTVSSLSGEDIAIFTRRLANRWGVGRKDVNDGVMVLVAPHEHSIRIQVGLGLERRLPNQFCEDVIRERLVPAFREGRIGKGIEAGVAAIIDKLVASER